MTSSAVYALAKHLLGEDPNAWVNARRAEGRSWRLVARDLWYATDQQIDVTTQTLQNWRRSNGDAA